MKWMFNEISNETEIEGIAFHTMCGVFNGEPKLNSLYYPFEYAEKRKTNIKCVGLYIFGGKMKDGQTLNTLSYIKLGMKPLKWLILETEGQKPNPRFYHSMNYYSQLNVLIIYGGKTDAPATIKMKDFDQIFSDVWILNLVTLNWMQVRTNRIADLDRCGHATTILGILYWFEI